MSQIICTFGLRWKTKKVNLFYLILLIRAHFACTYNFRITITSITSLIKCRQSVSAVGDKLRIYPKSNMMTKNYNQICWVIVLATDKVLKHYCLLFWYAIFFYYKLLVNFCDYYWNHNSFSDIHSCSIPFQEKSRKI